MPSTLLLAALLVIYVMITGRLIGALTNLRDLIKSGVFTPESLGDKLKKKPSDDNDDDEPDGEGDLPDPKEPVA